jgi:TPR repeat protein
MRPGILLLAPVLASLYAGMAFADPVEDGVDAALAGDYDTALKLLDPAVGRGDARAEFFLGILYETGMGVTKDATQAAKLYRLSAQQGLATAQNNLASLLADGNGVPQDLTEAMKWWVLAADQGLPVAQTNLADFYAHTRGTITQDYVQAYKWSRLAAAHGDADAVQILQDLTQVMSPDQIADGERLARAWRPAQTDGA